MDLAHYTLAVSPDATALYAVNPVLGRLVVVRDGLPYGRGWASPWRSGTAPRRAC